MITFFRKLRRTLLAKNKLARYLLYAMGEIILVIVGILIALQINAWNESKKARIYELKILKEIKASITQDLEHIEKLLKLRIQPTEESTQVLLNLLQQEKIDLEKFNKYIRSINKGYVFQYNNGAYQALKSSGIEKISNDLLRNELIQFYEFQIPRIEKLMSFLNSEQTAEKSSDLFWQLFDFEIKENKLLKNKLGIYYTRYKSNDFHDKRLYRLIHLKTARAQNAILRLKRFTEHSLNLLKVLNQELAETHD